MKNILIIIPSLVGGGAERVLINVLKQLPQEQYNIILYLGVKKGELIGDVPKSVTIKTLFPSDLIARIAAFIFRKTGNKLLFKLYGSKIKGNYTCGISFLDGPFTEFLFHNKAKISGKKVAVIHSSYSSFSNVSKSVKSPHFLRMKKRYAKIDTIVTVAHESMQEFKNLFGEYNDMRVIYNPINNAEVLQKANEPVDIENNNTGCTFLAIGSFVPVKGFERLINAASKLKKDNMDFTLTILGDGYLRPKLEELVQKHGLHKNVFLPGFKKNPYSHIKNADVLLMSSLSEGLPTVLCEAMILEKPVLVPNITGCREVIDHGKYGMMVPDSEEGLYEGMKKYITDSTLLVKYAQKAKDRKGIFDDKNAINSYLELFDGK